MSLGLLLIAVYALPTYFILIAVHELGHLLAALIVRLRVLRFVVGPLEIMRQGDCYRVVRPRSLFKFNGRVESYPLDSRPARARIAAFIAAGPLASLLFAGLCSAAALALNDPLPVDPIAQPISAIMPRNLVSALLGCTAWYSAAVAFSNLIPGQHRGVDLDGKKLLEMLLGGKRAERLLLTMRMNGYVLERVRARDWPVAQVDRLLAVREGSNGDAVANMLGYFHALDSGQVEKAGELLDLALSQRTGCSIVYRAYLLLEGAFYEGYYRNNASAARSWLERAIAIPGLEANRLRAEAAVLFSEGRYEEAIAQAEAALIAAATLPDFESDKDLLCALIAECRRHVPVCEKSETSAGPATAGG